MAKYEFTPEADQAAIENERRALRQVDGLGDDVRNRVMETNKKIQRIREEYLRSLDRSSN